MLASHVSKIEHLFRWLFTLTPPKYPNFMRPIVDVFLSYVIRRISLLLRTWIISCDYNRRNTYLLEKGEEHLWCFIEEKDSCMGSFAGSLIDKAPKGKEWCCWHHSESTSCGFWFFSYKYSPCENSSAISAVNKFYKCCIQALNSPVPAWGLFIF